MPTNLCILMTDIYLYHAYHAYIHRYATSNTYTHLLELLLLPAHNHMNTHSYSELSGVTDSDILNRHNGENENTKSMEMKAVVNEGVTRKTTKSRSIDTNGGSGEEARHLLPPTSHH